MAAPQPTVSDSFSQYYVLLLIFITTDPIFLAARHLQLWYHAANKFHLLQ
jgi:hypothetical protein